MFPRKEKKCISLPKHSHFPHVMLQLLPLPPLPSTGVPSSSCSHHPTTRSSNGRPRREWTTLHTWAPRHKSVKCEWEQWGGAFWQGALALKHVSYIMNILLSAKWFWPWIGILEERRRCKQSLELFWTTIFFVQATKQRKLPEQNCGLNSPVGWLHQTVKDAVLYLFWDFILTTCL